MRGIVLAGGFGHAALSDYQGREQTVVAHLRQTDGVLSHQRIDIDRINEINNKQFKIFTNK